MVGHGQVLPRRVGAVAGLRPAVVRPRRRCRAGRRRGGPARSELGRPAPGLDRRGPARGGAAQRAGAPPLPAAGAGPGPGSGGPAGRPLPRRRGPAEPQVRTPRRRGPRRRHLCAGPPRHRPRRQQLARADQLRGLGLPLPALSRGRPARRPGGLLRPRHGQRPARPLPVPPRRRRRGASARRHRGQGRVRRPRGRLEAFGRADLCRRRQRRGADHHRAGMALPHHTAIVADRAATAGGRADGGRGRPDRPALPLSPLGPRPGRERHRPRPVRRGPPTPCPRSAGRCTCSPRPATPSPAP